MDFLTSLCSLDHRYWFHNIRAVIRGEQDIENTRSVSFDIKFTRQGFENAG